MFVLFCADVLKKKNNTVAFGADNCVEVLSPLKKLHRNR